MPLPIPNLDDSKYADLVEEARMLIQTYDSSWTDHNPSDPGITLIELFAWLVEMLFYRANRVTDQHLIKFLKLLNDPEWESGGDLADDIRTNVVALRQRFRTVTCADYEVLAKQASNDVARAKCVPRRHLGANTEEDRVAPKPGHVSIIIVPQSGDPGSQPSGKLCEIVWNDLNPRRVLTTRHHVVGPVYTPVSADILIARQADVPAEGLRGRIVQALENFLHPLIGGPDGDGWPFGRDIFVSELYELLEGISGLDYVPDIGLSSKCPEGATRCVAATELWHDDGDLIGMYLAHHHLPWAQIEPSRIVISAKFVRVQVTVQATPKEQITTASARRAIKTAVKRFFHPLYGGPDGTRARTLTLASLRTLVQNLAEVETLIGLELRSDPKGQLQDELGQVTGVRIEARELADVQVTIILSR
jgi:hypothetical protein